MVIAAGGRFARDRGVDERHEAVSGEDQPHENDIALELIVRVQDLVGGGEVSVRTDFTVVRL